MSDEPFRHLTPALMSAVRARNLARHYKAFADHLREQGYVAEANRADRDSQWWMTYAIALSQVPPGAVDPNA